jgi:phage shock protein E
MNFKNALIIVFSTAIGLLSCTAQQKKVDYQGAFLVDVRTPGEFAEGTAKGGVNIPLNEIQQRIEEFKGKKLIVVYCRSGSRSAQAESILKKNGFTAVVNGGTWQTVDQQMRAQHLK